MSRDHIDHKDIKSFAEANVNLSSEASKKYRDQADRLRDDLKEYLKDHPDFSLRKILRSGSLAKRTALKSINDIDMACYIKTLNPDIEPENLIDDLEEHLRTAFPNISSDQVQRQKHSVRISFKGTGLDIDVVPINYDEDNDERDSQGNLVWNGKLLNQDDGSFLKTNVIRHIEFIKKRKNDNPNFAEVVRLLKTWARKSKRENQEFKFKSFMIELILAHLCDNGLDLSDYPDALHCFFRYITRKKLKEQIAFSDYYDLSKINVPEAPIKIIDPVNLENNVAGLYEQHQLDVILNTVFDAVDNLEYALSATTKSETVECWQQIFGIEFKG